ncbi:MAG: NTP transferase domain-containing protein [Verrucomicrobiota bacterium]
MNIMLLAGGASARMGREKALITRPDGTRQIDHLVSLAKLFSGSVFLSANDGDDRGTGLPVLADPVPGGGPLSALDAARETGLAGPWLMLGCDLFLLDEITIRYLIDHHDPARGATAYRNRIDDRAEPLCAIYETSALSSLPIENRCARSFLESLDPVLLDLPSPAAIDNANAPAELDEAFEKLQQGVTRKTIRITYFAVLRDARGLATETVETLACTAAGLYEEIRFRHRFKLPIGNLRVAKNDEFAPWNCPVAEGDEFVFIPPVAGG